MIQKLLAENIIAPKLVSGDGLVPELLVEVLERVLSGFHAANKKDIHPGRAYDKEDIRTVTIQFTNITYTICFCPVEDKIFSEAVLNKNGELIIFRDSVKNKIEKGKAGVDMEIAGFDPLFLIMLFPEWKELLNIKIANPRVGLRYIRFTDDQLKTVNHFISELGFDSSISEVLSDGSFKMPGGYVLAYESGGGGYVTLLNILITLFNSTGLTIFESFESRFHPTIRNRLMELIKETFKQDILIYYVGGYES